MKVAIVAVVLFASSALAALKYVPCDTSDDCEQTQCCVAEDRFWILSKREFFQLGENPKKGRCVNYIKEGSECYMAGFASCGCEPGTKCEVHHQKPEKPADAIHVIPDDTIMVGKRDFMPFFGTSECKKVQ